MLAVASPATAVAPRLSAATRSERDRNRFASLESLELKDLYHGLLDAGSLFIQNRGDGRSPEARIHPTGMRCGSIEPDRPFCSPARAKDRPLRRPSAVEGCSLGRPAATSSAWAGARIAIVLDLTRSECGSIAEVLACDDVAHLKVRSIKDIARNAERLERSSLGACAPWTGPLDRVHD